MTVIAYRDGIMAGDSCFSDPNQSGLVFISAGKVYRLRSGALYGSAGDVDDRQLRERLEDIFSPGMLPSALELEGMRQHQVQVILALPDGSVWRLYCGEPNPKDSDQEYGGVECVTAPYVAVGTGEQVAIGAFWKGATAIEAVKAACDHNIYCRPPVTHLKLKT